MPDLAEIADPDDLEDRYLDRPIVYVEDDSDGAVFTAIMGAELTARVTFKAPFQGGSGCMAVINRVRQERPHNTKIFGLVDGETAAVLGGIEAFLACDDHFFELPDEAEAEGVLFLSSHELENVLILHGGFCEHVRDDVRLRAFGTLTADQVRDILRQVTQRFFMAALLKYGVTVGTRAGETTPEFEIGWFLDPKVSAMGIVRRMREQLTTAGGDWAAFKSQLAAMIASLKGHFRAAGLDVDARRDDLVKLADGKGLMKGMKAAVDNRAARWESHLARALIERPYGDAFRERLLAFTAT